VLLALAKASLFCGVHYLNIAASHLQQCQAIRADYPGAGSMLKQLLTFESRLATANDHAETGSHAAAVVAYSEALDAVHEANQKVRVLVLLQRAESFLMTCACQPALEDCNIVLEVDGNNVKALLKRSRAYEGLADFRRALSDLEHASTLQEDVAAEIVALRLRMQRASQSTSSTNNSTNNSNSRPSTGYAGGTSRERPASSSVSSRSAAVSSLYDVLGVLTSCDPAQIRAAYRKLTLQLHPDKVVKEPEAVRRQCEVRFKEVAHAYSVLNDPVTRLQYDLQFRG
jgi:DnaJ-domain-containing protein 1